VPASASWRVIYSNGTSQDFKDGAGKWNIATMTVLVGNKTVWVGKTGAKAYPGALPGQVFVTDTSSPSSPDIIRVAGNRSIPVPVYVMSIPCGQMVGVRNYSCDADAWGKNVTYACPNVSFVPRCLFFNDTSQAWESGGIGLSSYNSTLGSFTCTTTHLTDFAARFSALGEEQEQVFAGISTLSADGGYLLSQPHLVVVLSCLVIFFLWLVWHSAELDAHGRLANFRAFAQDDEVSLLAHLESAAGEQRFILDSFLQEAVEKAMASVACAQQKECVVQLSGRSNDDDDDAVSATAGGGKPPLSVKSNSWVSLSPRDLKSHRALEPQASLPPPKTFLGAHTILSLIFNLFHLPEGLGHAKTHDGGGGSGGGLPKPSSCRCALPCCNVCGYLLSLLSNAKRREHAYMQSLLSAVDNTYGPLRVTADSLTKDLASSGMANLTETFKSLNSSPPSLAWLTTMRTHLPTVAPGTTVTNHFFLSTFINALFCCGGGAPASTGEDSHHIDAQTDIEASTHSPFCCSRLFSARFILSHIFSIRCSQRHACCAPFSNITDPMFSRVNRALLFLNAVMGTLFMVCFFYALRYGMPDEPLEEAGLSEELLISVIVIVIHLPIDIGLSIAFNLAGRAEFAKRYPFIAAEMEGRRVMDLFIARHAYQNEETANHGSSTPAKSSSSKVHPLSSDSDGSSKLQPAKRGNFYPPKLSISQSQFNGICDKASKFRKKRLEEILKSPLVCGFTFTSIITYVIFASYISFCFAYLVLFAAWMPAGDITFSWMLSQTWAMLFIKPTFLGLILLFNVFAIPNFVRACSQCTSPGPLCSSLCAGVMQLPASGALPSLNGHYLHYLLPRVAHAGAGPMVSQASRVTAFQWNTITHSLILASVYHGRSGEGSTQISALPHTAGAARALPGSSFATSSSGITGDEKLVKKEKETDDINLTSMAEISMSYMRHRAIEIQEALLPAANKILTRSTRLPRLYQGASIRNFSSSPKILVGGDATVEERKIQEAINGEDGLAAEEAADQFLDGLEETGAIFDGFAEAQI